MLDRQVQAGNGATRQADDVGALDVKVAQQFVQHVAVTERVGRHG
jgi:hypothetical protein